MAIIDPLASVPLRSNLLAALAERAAAERAAAQARAAGLFAQSGALAADQAGRRAQLVMEDAAQRRAIGQRGLEAGMQSAGDMLRLLYGQKQAEAENTLRRELAAVGEAAAVARQREELAARRELAAEAERAAERRMGEELAARRELALAGEAAATQRLNAELAARAAEGEKGRTFAATEAEKGRSFTSKRDWADRLMEAARLYVPLTARAQERMEDREREDAARAEQTAEAEKDRQLQRELHGREQPLPIEDQGSVGYASTVEKRIEETDDPRARETAHKAYLANLPEMLASAKDEQTRRILWSSAKDQRRYLTPEQRARLPLPSVDAQGRVVETPPPTDSVGFAGLAPMRGANLYMASEPRDPTDPAFYVPQEMLSRLYPPLAGPVPTSMPVVVPTRFWRLYGDE